MPLKSISHCIVLTFLVVIVVGCSATPRQSEWWKCALAGAAAGAVGGAMSDKEAATMGAEGGALLGGLICALSGEKESRNIDYVQDGVADEHDQYKNRLVGVPVDLDFSLGERCTRSYV